MRVSGVVAPPSLTLPHKGGGDSLAMASLSLIPSPLMGEGEGGGDAVPQDNRHRLHSDWL
jgi:hypothetical protein